ncbi:MAG: hypothetical protein GQ569_12785 [Methylococcaceae bacterium]|nr:hypothetical protein [Methylococcaceae bacterium]
MLMTVDIPNDLAIRLNPFKNELPQLLELGLHEYNLPKKTTGFQGVNEILEFLAKLPTPEEILALKPAQELQLQINTLLDKQRNHGLSVAEEQQWQQYEYLEHLVRIAKANALLKLQAKNE